MPQHPAPPMPLLTGALIHTRGSHSFTLSMPLLAGRGRTHSHSPRVPQVAAGRYAGFIQYEEELKAWDHACGLICIDEAGGRATDAEEGPVRFDGRLFAVKGGVVCTSRWASDEVRQAMLDAATGCLVEA